MPRIPPSSFRAYQDRMRGALTSLTPRALLAFCAWCGYRLLHRTRDLLNAEGINPDLLSGVLDVIWESLRDERPLSPSEIEHLWAPIRGIGPHDPVAAIEVHPLATDTLVCVACSVDCVVTESPECARGAAEVIINVLDYELDESGIRSELDTMFLIPEMRDEQDRQLKMVDYLSTADLSIDFRRLYWEAPDTL